MDIPLEEVLGFPILHTSVLRTARNARHRAVRWVSVIELPVENFVRANEFVLTTAMGCGNQPELLEQFVAEVASAKAAALGIATGRHIRQIPEGALALAEEHDLPIIEIPWEVRFAEITQAVSDALRKEEFGTLEAAQQIQGDVLDRILRGGSLSDVASVVGRRLGMPSLIVDARGAVLGRGAGSRKLEDLYLATLDADPGALCGAVSELAELKLPGGRLLLFPIRSTQRAEGHLVLLGAPEGPAPAIGARELQMLEHASTACAFWFLHQHAVRNVEARLRDDFIWSLAKGQIGDEQARTEGASLGYYLDRHHICILGHPDNLEEAQPGRRASVDPAQRARHTVAVELENVAQALQQPAMITYQRETFVVYLEVDPVEALQPAHRFLDRVDRRLHEVLPRLIVSWGIASAGSGPAAFAAGYKTALEALDIGYRRSGIGHRTASRDVLLYHTLLRLSQDSQVQELVAEVVDVLIEYDRRKSGELLPTLHTFIRTRGQISETARLLSLHRQSLIYRLSKIESLTGRSLSDPENWFLFSFALRIATLRPPAGEPA